MLSLYLLAAHAAGDFLLQTDKMAAHKFEDRRIRAAHVHVYCTTFVPVLFFWGWSPQRAAALFAMLWVTHFVVDSRRWVESTEEFPTFAVWYDQALHVVSLAIAVAASGVVV